MVKNPRRNVSIMMRLGSARIEGWQIDPTLVQLSATGSAANPRWANELPALIAALKALNVRELTEIEAVYQNPERFSTPDQHGDTYHVVYSEGMKPTHEIKSGIALLERSVIVHSVSQHMQGILVEDRPQTIDLPSVLKLGAGQTGIPGVRNQKLLAMFTQVDLEEIKIDVKAGEVQQQAKLRTTMEALHRTSENQPIRILLFHRTGESRQVMEDYVRRVLFVEESLPKGIEIKPIPVYGQAGASIDRSLADSRPWHADQNERQKMRKKWADDIRSAYDAKVGSWETLLRQHRHPDGCTLALIEMDGSIETATPHDDWYKSAIRRACVQQGVNSQMIFSVQKAARGWPASEEPISRLKHAVSDLVLRQGQVMYGPPSQIYRHAGLSDYLADNLVVLGIYRHRSNRGGGRGQVDLPLAAVLLPDGKVQVSLPSESGVPYRPVSYLEAGIRLGLRFAQYRNDDKDKALIDLTQWEDNRLSYRTFVTFITELITNDYSNRPLLVLLEADSWRNSALPSLTDGKLSKGFLDLSGKQRVPSQLPNVRVVRVRDAGKLGETPQYVPTSAEQWGEIEDADDLDFMFGIADTSVQGRLEHYYSIGGRPITAKGQDNTTYTFGEGADIAYRHQQAIELVPFFLQEGDDWKSWCRVPHFLRSSPAWNGGNTVLPYPLHLVKTLIEDQLDVFRPV